MRKKRKTFVTSLLIVTLATQSYANIIPIGGESNKFYYRVCGSNFSMPPVSDTRTTLLDTSSNLGLGYSCGAYNPALSITNSINNLKDSADNLEQNIVSNATGSLIQLPMYLLAQANPTAYNLLNNTLLNAHKTLDLSTKSCETVKSQIANGQNPYQDWGTLSLNNQWKEHLSLVSSGNEDINESKKAIEAHQGEDGLPWIQGKSSSDNSLHAGGQGQPPVSVISDTVKAGYNAMLNRDLQSNDDAPDNTTDTELKNNFPNPKAASAWATSVVGDEVITTCNDTSCQKAQASIVGHGLLPFVTSCQNNKDNCADSIRDELSQLVSGGETLTKDNLEKVSAEGIAISPDVIASIRSMDTTQQTMIITKLGQEIAMQRVIDKAFVIRHILVTGEQVPVIASNHPAQVIINRAIKSLDDDIQSLVFENDVRKRTMSDTISEVLKLGDQEQQDAMHTTPVSSNAALMEGGAMPASKEKNE